MNHIDDLIKNNASLGEVFLWSLSLFPTRNALWADNQFYTYEGLYQRSQRISMCLMHYSGEICLIYSRRSVALYSAILGVLLSGKVYAPIDCRASPLDVVNMISIIQSDLLVLDMLNTEHIKTILQLNQKSLTIVVVEHCVIPDWLKQLNRYHIVFTNHVYAARTYVSVNAYLLFTSGTTGDPKGIMVSHQNVLHYLARMLDRFDINEQDRFTQLADVTFDFSVHDMFLPWSIGACVYSMNHIHLMRLDDYMNDYQLTCWASVPSTIAFLKFQNRLSCDSLSSLRYSIFCGEPFFESLAHYWRSVSPHTVIDNLYGPTEAAVACMGYRWVSSQRSFETTVPIGLPFREQDTLIWGDDNPRQGELLLSGPQVVNGYWNNPSLTKQRFINVTDDHRYWYRTHDLVCWEDDVGFVYQGRLDDQVKIRGQAVSRLAIEARLKQLLQVDSVAVIMIPVTHDFSSCQVIAFVADCKLTVKKMMALARAQLPDVMVPKEIIPLDAIPINLRGKTDYSQIKRIYEKRSVSYG